MGEGHQSLYPLTCSCSPVNTYFQRAIPHIQAVRCGAIDYLTSFATVCTYESLTEAELKSVLLFKFVQSCTLLSTLIPIYLLGDLPPPEPWNSDPGGLQERALVVDDQRWLMRNDEPAGGEYLTCNKAM